MININGTLIPSSQATISFDNRGFSYGDAVFETIKCVSEKILFWEDHYFRLMSSMRILRMEIPMTFTPEFLENQIIELINANDLKGEAVRVKLMVNRKTGGYYTPVTNEIDYLIEVKALSDKDYKLRDNGLVIDLYKDFFLAPGLLSNLKTNNRLINVLGGVFAQEQELDNCLLLNTDKMVVEALNGNIFLVNGTTIKTPPLSDGCIKGIIRKQLIELIKKDGELELKEESVSPFEIQKSDEMFITNCISGLISVRQYRKKEFTNTITKKLIDELNKRVHHQL